MAAPKFRRTSFVLVSLGRSLVPCLDANRPLPQDYGAVDAMARLACSVMIPTSERASDLTGGECFSEVGNRDESLRSVSALPLRRHIDRHDRSRTLRAPLAGDWALSKTPNWPSRHSTLGRDSVRLFRNTSTLPIPCVDICLSSGLLASLTGQLHEISRS